LTGCYYVGPNPNGPNAAFVKQPPQTVVPSAPVAYPTQPEQQSEWQQQVKQTAAVAAEWMWLKGKQTYEWAKENSKQ